MNSCLFSIAFMLWWVWCISCLKHMQKNSGEVRLLDFWCTVLVIFGEKSPGIFFFRDETMTITGNTIKRKSLFQYGHSQKKKRMTSYFKLETVLFYWRIILLTSAVYFCKAAKLCHMYKAYLYYIIHYIEKYDWN